MPKCKTCGLDPLELRNVLTTLDLLKVVVTALAHDPAFKEQGGIRIPADVVKQVKEQGQKFGIVAEKGDITVTAIEPQPTIHIPGNERVN